MYALGSKNTPKVMIVDDVEANRYILKNIITDMGCVPVLAESCEQAVKLLPHCLPKLILLDIAMPGMDGFDFCKLIKNNANTRSIPIIFISAFDDTEDILKGFELGGEDYITKPFIPEVVKSRVGVHLKLYSVNQNLLEANRRLQTSLNEQLRQIEQEKKNVLYALANIAENNASYDAAHMERQQYNCRILAQGMQLSPVYAGRISDGYIEAIEMAAPLCDVGNVAIPEDLLKKKTILSPEEMILMQTHTTVGAKLLQDVSSSGDYNEYMQMSIDIAHYHHENWDGSGYPCGLKGNEIPLAAQIVAVINTFCALTEARTYRDLYGPDEALMIMERDVGVRFAADIFDVCKKIYRQFH